MSLEQISKGLQDAYDYIVVPIGMMDTPVELTKLEKYDDTGLVIGHYSINELSVLLGNKFIPTKAIDDRFMKFRWSIPRNGEEALIVNYLLSSVLVDMRDNGIVDALNFTVEEIDFTTLVGNEFGVFSNEEIKLLPAIETLI